MPKTYHPIGRGMTPSSTDAGMFLRAWRLKLGLSQAEVARRAGIPQQSYSALERGTLGHQSLSHHVDTLAQALECDPSELRVFIPAPEEPQTDLGKLISARRQELGLEITDLAERTGITRMHLSRLERGRLESIGFRKAHKLARALALPTSAFEGCISEGARERKVARNPLAIVIRSRRRELGLSVEEVASSLQVTRQLISAIEVGKVFLQNDNRLVQLAAVLRMDPEELRRLCPKRRVNSRKKISADQGSLAAFVFERRLELQLSQQEVEERAGVRSFTISTIETGKAHRLSVDAEFWRNLGAVLQYEIPQTLIPLRKERKSTSGIRMVRIGSTTTFGDFLASKRKELGFSQEALAQKVDIPRQRLIYLESGQTKRPRAHELRKFADVFRCDIEVLHNLIPNLVRVPTVSATDKKVPDLRQRISTGPKNWRA